MVAGGGSIGLDGLDVRSEPATAVQLNGPTGLAVDGGGNLFISVSGAFCVVKVTPSGQLLRVAGTPGSKGTSGDGAPATEARLGNPTDIRVDGLGNLYILDSDVGAVRFVDLTPRSYTLTPPFAHVGAAAGQGQFGLTVTPAYTAWDVTSTGAWLTSQTSGGTGDGTVAYRYTRPT